MTPVWNCGRRSLPLDRPLVMGIVNVTPDSFSDGGRHPTTEAAVAHARKLLHEGADILDIGGESTRPGSAPVDAAEELRRVLPVVQALRPSTKVPLSVDTRKAIVARDALDAGADIVNDVTALHDPMMAGIVAARKAGLVLMHMKGEPGTMQHAPTYHDVAVEVRDFLKSRAEQARAAGVAKDAIVLDPGLGFGKRTGHGIEDNLVLLRRLDVITSLGYPVLVGASRKTFLGNVLGVPLAERLEGSLAAAAIAVWNGASIVRVHDVQATRRVVDLVHAVRAHPNP